jgi:hypothetical protein
MNYEELEAKCLMLEAENEKLKQQRKDYLTLSDEFIDKIKSLTRDFEADEFYLMIKDIKEL